MEREIFLPLDSFGYARLLRADDINDAYIDALNNTDLTVFLETKGRSFTRADLVAYAQENLSDPCAFLLGVFAQDGTLVGTSRVHDIAQDGSSCWMGIFLFHRDVMGKGLGSCVVRAVSDYMLKTHKIGVVQAGIIMGNDASRACFRKADFMMLENAQSYNGRVREVWGRSLPDV